MHAIKGSWSGQAFALATSNDSGGRKSRIRRSKEERKAMVESFIKKYQKSNSGNFPSLRLTHKEVGGSFYTVREIVREIIQENRVLAPPKVSLEEHIDSEFLEQHPLGSISMEPQIDFSISDNVTHFQLNGSYPLESDNERIKVVVSKVTEKDEGCDRTNESHQAPNHYLINNDDKIVNGIEVPEEDSHFDKPAIINIDRQDNNDSALLSSQTINGPGSQRLTESTVTEILDKEKYGTRVVEASQTAKSRVTSNVIVETFPLRPVPGTIHDMDGESGYLQEGNGTFEADEKVVLNQQGSSLESSKYSSASQSVVLDIGDITDLESEDSLPVGTKADSSFTKCLVSEDSTVVETKASSGQDNNNPPTLDRINLETWEGASKKYTRPESNPLVALVKAFISSFVKFWS